MTSPTTPPGARVCSLVVLLQTPPADLIMSQFRICRLGSEQAGFHGDEREQRAEGFRPPDALVNTSNAPNLITRINTEAIY